MQTGGDARRQTVRVQCSWPLVGRRGRMRSASNAAGPGGWASLRLVHQRPGMIDQIGHEFRSMGIDLGALSSGWESSRRVFPGLIIAGHRQSNGLPRSCPLRKSRKVHSLMRDRERTSKTPRAIDSCLISPWLRKTVFTVAAGVSITGGPDATEIATLQRQNCMIQQDDRFAIA